MTTTITPCSANPCSNNGTCTFIGADFMCDCPDGFTGLTCESTPCSDNPCLNDASCEITGSSFQCSCQKGFSGENCEKTPCSGNLCSGNGTCLIVGSNYECICDEDIITSAPSEYSSSDRTTYSPILDVLLDREFTGYPLDTDKVDLTTTQSTLLPSTEELRSTTTDVITVASEADILSTTETYSAADAQTKPNTESGMNSDEFYTVNAQPRPLPDVGTLSALVYKLTDDLKTCQIALKKASSDENETDIADDLTPWMQYVLAHSTHSETFKDLLSDRFCDMLNFQIRVSTRGLELKREIINKKVQSVCSRAGEVFSGIFYGIPYNCEMDTEDQLQTRKRIFLAKSLYDLEDALSTMVTQRYRRCERYMKFKSSVHKIFTRGDFLTKMARYDPYTYTN
ncbi:unnamed protein product [Oikopleura dioica]|uniref:EGF-like domain-containing protein n=1 Tax=Oikopleura dioica TaxID=34765 RepID=E4WY24_OIKDI|nr:unnamed protein product [Oikopleura dioica]